VETRYPIKAVAKITGLSLDTLRAWERRYQAVVPERSERGRQYGPADIDRLILLSRLVQRGHAIGGIAALSEPELHKLLREPSGQVVSGPESATGILGPVLEAIERFDSARAAEELSRLAAVLAPRDLVYQVTLPLMHEVGVRWHSGVFAIAQEHLVSGLIRNLLGSMMRLFRTSAAASKVVVATPAGESHEFGILASAMILAMNGIEAVYLGPNLPAREISQAAERVSAKAVLLGITMLTQATAEEVGEIAKSMPESAELWVGGAGIADINLSNLARTPILLKDLPALENECRRWRN
jgi:methanogenic corrinoid protein MtbC1